jgi:hypothetical protein
MGPGIEIGRRCGSFPVPARLRSIRLSYSGSGRSLSPGPKQSGGIVRKPQQNKSARPCGRAVCVFSSCYCAAAKRGAAWSYSECVTASPDLSPSVDRTLSSVFQNKTILRFFELPLERRAGTLYRDFERTSGSLRNLRRFDNALSVLGICDRNKDRHHY